MTTKNSEIIFDLQKFSTNTTVQAATTTLSTIGAYNAFDTIGTQMAVVGGSGNNITVNAYNTLSSALGGWVVADNMTNGVINATLYGASETKPAGVTDTIAYGDTVYDHNATFTYYSFSGSNNSFTIANGTATDSTAAAASNTYLSMASNGTLKAGISFEDSIKAASAATPITLTGGDVQNVSLSGIGSIASFTNEQQLALAASGGRMSLTGVNGNVALSALNNTLRQNINGATINAAVTSGDITIDGGDGWAAPTLSAAGVSLGAIDTVQTWLVNEADYGGVSAWNTITGAQITVTGSDNTSANYMNVNVNNGESVALSTISGSTVRDTIGINGVILNGAARGHANVAANTDDSLLTAAYSTVNGFTVGGAGTIGGAISNVAAGGIVTVSTAGTAHITAVDKVGANATWALGANASVATLGNDIVNFNATNETITAASNGTQVAVISGSAAVSLAGDHTVAVGSTGAWTLGAANSTVDVIGSFDSLGNATVASGATLIGGSNKSLAIGANGANDTLSLGSGGQVLLDNDGVVTAASSLAADSTWLVKGGSTRNVTLGTASDSLNFNFGSPSSSGVFAEISVSTLSSAPVEIDELSGNVTVSAASSTISGLNVAGTTWSVSGTSDGTANFNSTGKLAAVTATSSTDLTVVAAATDASVTVSMTGDTMGGTFNGVKVYVHDGDSVVGVQLESDSSVYGISGITSLNSGATVSGDNSYQVNGNFNIYKGNNSDTKFTLGGSSQITIENVVSGDAYTVTGASGSTIVYDLIDSSVTSAVNSANVSLNGAAVTVTASTDSSINSAYIQGTSDDAIAVIGGVKLNDTITSSTADKKFTVIYDTSNVSTVSGDTYVMAANDAKVSLNADDLASIGTAITMNVDNSGSVPYITLSAGIANSSTVTVGKGVYKVGQSDAVTVNDNVGYLSIDSTGNKVTAEDSMVADIRRERNSKIDSLASSIGSYSEGAYYDFANLYYNNNNVFGDHNATVASYENATVATRYSTVSPSGVNIFGNTNLSEYPNSVTLQSYVSNPINIEHIEGKVDGQATVANVVIDVRNSANQAVLVGHVSENDTSSYENFATNHTILGAANSRNSTLVVGERATGDNMIVGGSNNDYIVHRGSGKATIDGGDGNDTIEATSNDSVKGGAGADLFFDTNAFEISDYSYTDGDVIIATKLSQNATLTNSNVLVNRNTIAIAGGSTLSIGASDEYNDNSATKAIIVDASISNNRTHVIWAGQYESTVDASDFPKNNLIISDNNEAGDSVKGSANADVAYIGGGDTINSGAGKDVINIASANGNQKGAVVVLSEDSNTVHGWTGGFDNEGGSNIIDFDPSSTLQASAATLQFKTKNNAVVAYTTGASLNFDSSLTTSSNGGYDFLVGQDKVTFIESGKTVSVTSDDALATYYKGESNAGLYIGESVTSELAITLGSANYANITKLDLHNENHASVWGSANIDTITVVGSADAGAGKTVAAGAGNDYIVSGGNDTNNAGNYLFFGSETGANGETINYSTGRDNVSNFAFYRASEDIPVSNADVIYLGNYSSFQSPTVRANQIEFALGDSDRVFINDSFSTSDNKIIRTRFLDNKETTFNCKFGLTTSNATNNFTYDGVTNVYYGNYNRGRDTLSVSSNLNTSSVGIWLGRQTLGDKVMDENYYVGVTAINAGALSDSATKATLAGNATTSNIIQAANGGSTTLWGGGGASNTLIGGSGDDTFYYHADAGYNDDSGALHSSNDVIQGVQNDDLIWVDGVTVSQLTQEASISSSQISIAINDSSLTITNMSTDTRFRVANGSGGWDDYSLNISGNTHTWTRLNAPAATQDDDTQAQA